MSSLKYHGLTITKNAVSKIHSLIEREQSEGSSLRISVLGGGCSGFKYSFKMDRIKLGDSEDDDDYDDDYDDDEYEEDDDEIVEDVDDIVLKDCTGKPILIVDKASNKFLSGSVIDYVDDLNGAGFVVNNPMAKSRCGCGNSFTV